MVINNYDVLDYNTCSIRKKTTIVTGCMRISINVLSWTITVKNRTTGVALANMFVFADIECIACRNRPKRACGAYTFRIHMRK